MSTSRELRQQLHSLERVSIRQAEAERKNQERIRELEQRLALLEGIKLDYENIIGQLGNECGVAKRQLAEARRLVRAAGLYTGTAPPGSDLSEAINKFLEETK